MHGGVSDMLMQAPPPLEVQGHRWAPLRLPVVVAPHHGGGGTSPWWWWHLTMVVVAPHPDGGGTSPRWWWHLTGGREVSQGER